MATINQFSSNLNIVSQLDDQPSLSASDLKAKFDEAGNTIKTWINSTLIPFINGIAAGTNIGTGAISNAKIADGAVYGAKIADGAITSAKIGSKEVKTANIADGAITTAKISGAGIDGQYIQNGSIPSGKNAMNSIYLGALYPTVQTSIGKADTAYQKPGTGIPSSDLATQTIIKVSGSLIYGSSLPGSGVTGQIFFKKV